jgi:hypothetical protein
VDSLVQHFECSEDGDLNLCPLRGIAYQRDMTVTARYDQAYLERCAAYDPEISARVHQGRVDLVRRHHRGEVLDVGIGSGEFIERHGQAYGYDVNDAAVDWLKERGKHSESFDSFRAFCFWDTLEHVRDPQLYFRVIPQDSYLFVSLPIFDGLAQIRDSKHYRPGEHLYYFTETGLVSWLRLYGFRLLETSDHETDAGREGIKAFAFRRDLPTASGLLEQHRWTHARRYVAPSYDHLPVVLPVVRELQPASILDYGCGRSDLLAHLYLDGARRIARFDPAIPEVEKLPVGRYDLVLCLNVLEYVPLTDLERVLAELKSLSPHVLLAIDLEPERLLLYSGARAHVTLLTRQEWLSWLGSVFGVVTAVSNQRSDFLLVRTW